jgi:hypothetical protein
MFGYILNPSNLIGLSLGGQDITGMFYSMPLWLLAIFGIAALVGIIGILGRIKAVLTGKGTGMDFIVVVIILVIAALMAVLVTGRVVKSIGIL